MLLGRTCINTTRKLQSISPTIFRSASKLAREMKIENGNFGQYFNIMRNTWKQKNRPPIVVLRNLLLAIEEENHGKFALLGVQWFQDKGMDFDKETAGLFIKKCLLTNRAKDAAILISKWKNRISAWMSVGSTNSLINQLLIENATTFTTATNDDDDKDDDDKDDGNDADNSDTENFSLLLAAKVLNIRMRKGLDLAHGETAINAVLTSCCTIGLAPTETDNDDDEGAEKNICKVKESYELVMEAIRIVSDKETEMAWRKRYALTSSTFATDVDADADADADAEVQEEKKD